MYYHVRIRHEIFNRRDELKLDLSEEKLRNQFIAPYENGENIIVNGKTILPDDIERIKINKNRSEFCKINTYHSSKNDKKSCSNTVAKRVVCDQGRRRCY